MEQRFAGIIDLIKESRNNAIKSVNKELINLYWNVGAYIRQKLSASEWGDKTVDELAIYIKNNNSELKGFDRRGLYRMMQFYETYASQSIVSSARTHIHSVDNQSDKIVSSLWTQSKYKI